MTLRTIFLATLLLFAAPFFSLPDGPLAATCFAQKSGKPKSITFDDVKFDIKKGAPFKRSMLPAKIEKLNKKRISVKGYMRPSYQQKGIMQFVLVRDNQECCFGKGAALYDCILVEMAPKKGASFTVRPITVEGVFTVREFKGPDGKHLAIYHLVGEKVK